MSNDDRQRLIDRLSGTSYPLGPAMMELGIEEGLNIAKVEISEAIAPCRVCSRWTDVDVMEGDLCMRCDEKLNPDNQQKP